MKSISFCVLFAMPLLASEPSRRVVVIVWDGMRPDFISEQNTPTLFGLARRGVNFRNHHSVYISATEVNGTAISTGAYPERSGMVGNNEYRPWIDPLKPIHTEILENVRKGDDISRGHYLHSPTLAEIVRQAGRKTTVAGAKAVALLHDRRERTDPGSGITLFAGTTLPPTSLSLLTNRYGAFPAESGIDPRRNDWTVNALLEPLWGRQVPDFTLIWMNEPDWTQHQTGPGSERTIDALRNCDHNLARILRALQDHGAATTTDIFVVSDHGASTVSVRLDLVEVLTRGGLTAVREFQRRPARGEILVVSNGGSSFIYVIDHDEQIISKVVQLLQQWEYSGVIFTRKALPGTFALHEARLDCEGAPDVVLSLRWSDTPNKDGTRGSVASDIGSFAPGQGSHVTLSPFDMHATLVAAGPDFRAGVVNTLATGNVDVAPTVLWVLGLKSPQPMDGRVLTEALKIKGPPVRSFDPHHLEASTRLDASTWSQYLNVTEVNGVRYLDEGNGSQTPNR